MQFTLSVERSILRIDPEQWNLCATEHPFLKHAFFKALEESNSIGKLKYALPQYIVLRDQNGNLAACAPAMLKTGTLTEYGPEYQWLEKGLETGCFSWPKFQVGIPLYPISSPKLLTRPDLPKKHMQEILLKALKFLARDHYKVCALNIMQVTRDLAKILHQDNWLLSEELHGEWHNPGCANFSEYIAMLPNRKRYLVNKERRLVNKLGLDIRTLSGHEISDSLLENYYIGHERVCLRYGNHTWLPREMFNQLIRLMPESVRLIAAFDHGKYVAGAFCLLDSETLYVRTWSAIREIPQLCFELICYRPICYALDNRLSKIDSGLNGTHKRHRGFVDKPVFSAHWFFNENLRALAKQVLSPTCVEVEATMSS